jgi:TolB-like protein/DNA-binding winged helix-turn-helix (wHTH) protein
MNQLNSFEIRLCCRIDLGWRKDTVEEMQPEKPQAIFFDGFTLDLLRGCLRRGGVEVKLRPKSFDLLRFLVENHGRLVSKEELIRSVWADTAVTDNSLAQCLIEIRRGLDDDLQTIIRNVPRRGYIFDARVADAAPAPTEGSAQGVPPQIQEPLSPPRLSPRWRPAIAAIPVLAAAVLAVALNVGGVRRWLPGSSAAQAIRSIVVLPLEGLSNEADLDYFADGMTDALITDLAQIEALRVISRTTAMHYKKTKKALPEIAQELNVDAAVEGTAVRSGNRVRITTQLLLAREDKHIWAEAYERDLQDIPCRMK